VGTPANYLIISADKLFWGSTFYKFIYYVRDKVTVYTYGLYLFINVYLRLKPEWSFKLNVFEFYESFINVFKQIYRNRIEFAR